MFICKQCTSLSQIGDACSGDNTSVTGGIYNNTVTIYIVCVLRILIDIYILRIAVYIYIQGGGVRIVLQLYIHQTVVCCVCCRTKHCGEGEAVCICVCSLVERGQITLIGEGICQLGQPGAYIYLLYILVVSWPLLMYRGRVCIL